MNPGIFVSLWLQELSKFTSDRGGITSREIVPFVRPLLTFYILKRISEILGVRCFCNSRLKMLCLHCTRSSKVHAIEELPPRQLDTREAIHIQMWRNRTLTRSNSFWCVTLKVQLNTVCRQSDWTSTLPPSRVPARTIYLYVTRDTHSDDFSWVGGGWGNNSIPCILLIGIQ